MSGEFKENSEGAVEPAAIVIGGGMIGGASLSVAEEGSDSGKLTSEA